MSKHYLFFLLLFVSCSSSSNKNQVDNIEHSTSLRSNISYHNNSNCSDAVSSLEEAYSYSKKAYNADNINDLHDYAKKAMRSASDAESYASDCKCSEAESAASDANRYAKKAYNEDNFSDAQSYIKKAKGYCDDALSAANDCK